MSPSLAGPSLAESSEVSQSTLPRLLALLGRYWLHVSGAVWCALADTIAQVAAPLVISIAVDAYLLHNPGPARRWLPESSGDGLLWLSLCYLAVIAAGMCAQALQSYLSSYTGAKAMADLRKQVFAHLQQADIAYFDANPVGRLVTRLTNDIESLSEAFADGVIAMAANLLMAVFFLIALTRLSLPLALVLTCVLPLFAMVAALFRHIVTPFQRRTRTLVSRMNATLAEHINGVSVLQLFNHEELSQRSFDGINTQYRDASMGWITANNWFIPSVEMLGTFSQAGLLCAGAWLLTGGTLTLGTLVAFLQYGTRFLRPIQDLSERFGILQNSIVSAERVFGLLEAPATPDHAIGNKLPTSFDIEFDGVWFAYQGEQWVLRNVSFRIESGKSLAIVGHTGAGKTTLSNLLLRFYEPQRGTIRIGGIDLRDIPRSTLRQLFGTVLQQTYIHSGTIRENILFGLHAPGDRATRTAEAIHFHSLAGQLPQGLDTPVSERGDNLSAGQKQLIGFARALCRNPKLLILDEATSDIDVATEARLQTAIGPLLTGRTSVIIAHRLSTVLRAHRILVLHKGEVREFGTHAQLLARQGLYWRLYQLQFQSQESPALASAPAAAVS